MKRFLSALLLVLLLYTAGFSYMELTARAESAPPPGQTLLSGEGEATPAPTPPPTPIPVLTPAPEPSPAPTAEPENTPAPETEAEEPPAPSPAPEAEPEPAGWQPGYYIMVNIETNTVNIYSSDDEGVFNVPVRAMICSTGDDTPTSGVYTLGWRLRWQTLFGGVYGQYVTQIVGNILFHSVPYTVNGDPSTLEYWEFDQLGTSCSAGCVRLQVTDAKWIYDNMYSIVGVEFYSSSDPGPLGKPSAPLISDNERCRGWDPTDPNPNNPWLSDEPEEPPAPEPTDALPPEEEGEELLVVGGEPEPEPEPEPDPEPDPEPGDDDGDDLVIVDG